MELYTVLSGIVVVILVSALLKIANVIHLRKEKEHQDQLLASFELLAPKVPYEKYQRIAQRSSVPNKPVRISDSFLDFVLSIEDCNREDFAENKLFRANCGRVIHE